MQYVFGKNQVDTLKVSTTMHKALIYFNLSKTNMTLHITKNYLLKLGQQFEKKNPRHMVIFHHIFDIFPHFCQKLSSELRKLAAAIAIVSVDRRGYSQGDNRTTTV